MRKFSELKFGDKILCESYDEYEFIKKIINPEERPDILQAEIKHYWKIYSNSDKQILYEFGLGTEKFRGSYQYKASEFMFPKQWCIKNAGTQEFRDVVINWLNSVDHSAGYEGNDMWYWIDEKNYALASNIKPQYVTEITLEEFKEHVLKSDKMDKKIIGYKCPVEFEVSGTKYPKGTVYVKFINNKNLYVPSEDMSTVPSVPAALVETWEPVYEENIKIFVPNSSYEVKIINKNSSEIDGYSFPRSFWQSALEVSTHSKAKVMIGCNHQFNIDEKWILSVLNAMDNHK